MNLIIRKVSAYSLFFACILLSFSCQKEVSYELPSNTPVGGTGSAGSTAGFSLLPSGGNCSDALVAGSYEKGKAVGLTNLVAFSVNVSKTGTWVYSTGILNGIGFSGSGTFSSTGTQIITLMATGTPTADGDFSFPLNIESTNCSFSVKVAGAGTGGSSGTTNAMYYYKATIGGVDYRQEVTETNGFEVGSGMGGDNDVVFGGGINYANPPLPAGKTEMGAAKGIMHNYLRASNADFKAFFAPGEYPYMKTGTHEGVSIGWTDPNGENWDSSEFGSGDQTGSSFKIISVDDNFDAIGNYYIRVKIQFTCKLYNMNTGSMKQATNGEMVVLFGKL